MPFAATWMDLEIIISQVREVRQKKTSLIWYHLYAEFLKNYTNELIYKTETDSTELENKLMVTRREGRQAGTDWEFGIDMYTLLYLE